MLSDFRSNHEAVLDRLLTDSVTALVKDGLISLERLAQDGVKAAAGAASFRRQGRLTAIREQMAERIEQLKSERESGAAAGQGRKQAARCAQPPSARSAAAKLSCGCVSSRSSVRCESPRGERRTGRRCGSRPRMPRRG